MTWYILVRYNYGPDGKLWDKPGPITISDDKTRIEPMIHKEAPCKEGWSEWKMLSIPNPLGSNKD